MTKRITISIEDDFDKLVSEIVKDKKYGSKPNYVKSVVRSDLEAQGYITKGGAPE